MLLSHRKTRDARRGRRDHRGPIHYLLTERASVDPTDAAEETEFVGDPILRAAVANSLDCYSCLVNTAISRAIAIGMASVVPSPSVKVPSPRSRPLTRTSRSR
jgi:hypothetical protein